MSLRILLTGNDWVGDVLGGCRRALEELDVDFHAIATNEPSERFKELEEIRDRAASIPFIGAHCANVVRRLTHEQRLDEIRRVMADALRERKPDVLIALVDGLYPVLPDVLADFPDVLKIGWVLDDPFYYNSAARFDFHAFNVLYSVEDSLVAPLQQAAGRPVSCVPLAADTATYRLLGPPHAPERPHDVVFVGKSYINSRFGVVRKNLLARVADLGLSIWGDPSWRQVTANGVDLGRCYRGGPVRPEGTNRIYNRSRIVVNILHPQIRCGTSLRTFAISAAGAFQLVEWRPGLEEMFELGREIVAYRCGEELEQQARHYLSDVTARIAIAAAGHRRVAAQHTYVHRLRHILADVDLTLPGRRSIRTTAVSH